MLRRFYRPRLTLLPRARAVAAATLVAGVLATGCGGGSPTTTAAAAGSVKSRPLAPGAIAFANCMRASGVPSFPDPTGGHGLSFPASGAVISSPAFTAAQAKCQKLLPGGGPGSGPPPSARTMAKLLKISRCMRRHGISGFPDPQATRPSNLSLGKYREITDFDGAILLFPPTINLQAPAYRQALTACGAPPLGLPH